MRIKLPMVIDLSHWEQVVDWDDIEPRPVLIATKATEGNWYRDDTFLSYWAGMKFNGFPRMCYHFNRKSIPGQIQAKYFIDFIQPAGIVPDDLLCLDLEEGGESAKEIINWIAEVEMVFPHNRILIYSRKNILEAVTGAVGALHPVWDLISMTETQSNRLRQYPTWIAGYPTFPDDFNELPAFYVPDQTKWGPVALWQYSPKGVLPGINGEVDVNWIAAWFHATLPDKNIPPIGADMNTYDLTVMTAALQGRSSPAVVANPSNNIFPNGFKLSDKLTAGEPVVDVNHVTKWYPIHSGTRNGVPIVMPPEPLFASDGGSLGYLRVDKILPSDPNIEQTYTATLHDDLTGDDYSGELTKQ